MIEKQPEALRLAEILDSFHEADEVQPMAAELRRLHAVNAELLKELRNIAKANQREWGEEMRDQFQQWAQSRARHTIAKAEGGAA